jgi:site-specific recombinase XerD
MVADYMLFAVKALNLKDDGDIAPVIASEIYAAGIKWEKYRRTSQRYRNGKNCKKTLFLDFTIKWLTFTGRIDPMLVKEENLFFSFSTYQYYRLRYLGMPLMQERLDYLHYLQSKGYTYNRLRETAETQLHLVDILNFNKLRFIAVSEINELMNSDHYSKRFKKNIKATTRGWFSFLGILKNDIEQIYNAEYIDQYCDWLLKVKGCSNQTEMSRRLEMKEWFRFLNCNSEPLSDIGLETVDRYIKHRYASGCSRRTVATIVVTLRDFLKYASNNGWCEINVDAIKGPRLYKLESLPEPPLWNTMLSIIKTTDTDKAVDIRDHAILLLLTVYGIRCGEVTGLQLDDIDWENDTIFFRRVKRCRPQIFPLDATVGNALVRYISEVRGNEAGISEIFISLQAPYKLIGTSAIYRIVSSRLKNTGKELRHFGPHALRHGCATHMVNNGHTLKDVSDLLGHRQLDTTRMYAKVDLNNLRKVSQMNWEGLL